MSFLVVALFLLVAGRVLAFDIPVGNTVFKTSEILALPESPVTAACASNCTLASSRIDACADDTACLCQPDTFAAVLGCETCMFHFLIATNKPAPDPRAGSNVVLSGYLAGCPALPPVALSLPATWDGPLVSVLPVGGAVATAAVGAVVGFGFLYMLCTL